MWWIYIYIYVCVCVCVCVCTVELQSSGRWLSGPPIIQIGLALRVNSSRIINLIVAPCIVCGITSIYQPTNAHIISHKKILKHFKTLRHVSILSDHHQGPLFLAKVMLQYTSFANTNWIVCTPATAPQHIPTQHDMLSQHLVCKYELNCE